MLVDDSEDFLRAASALLGSEGVAIVGQASSGSRALQLAAVTEPDVILVDVELGLEDGFEVARHLHRAHLPSKVVLISLRDQDGDRIEETGAIGFLRKDVLDRLAIQHLLDSSKSPRSSHRTPSLVHPSSRHALMLQKEVALRRVATMVAHQVAVSEIVEAVSDELTQILGLSYAEAAEVSGCAVGTIRSRVARAREELVALQGGADDGVRPGRRRTGPRSTGDPVRKTAT